MFYLITEKLSSINSTLTPFKTLQPDYGARFYSKSQLLEYNFKVKVCDFGESIKCSLFETTAALRRIIEQFKKGEKTWK